MLISDVRIIFLFCLMAIDLFAANPELRGVWVDRVTLASREEMRSAFSKLADAHFNAVFVNVWSRGYPLWRSRTFETETGLITDPGFADRDVLAEAIEEAQPFGLAVIPWFEYGFVAGYSGYLPGPAGKGPIFEKHPDWLAQARNGSTAFPIAGGGNYYWLAHSRTDVQDFLIALLIEIAGYGVPAIEFDRARYPSLDCGYDPHTRELYASQHDGSQPPENASDAEWVRWRANEINTFHKRMYRALKAANWRLLITDAPVVYPFSYQNFAQDYTAWVREGSLDFVSPQVYRSTSTAYEAELARQISQLSDSSRVVPGIDITNSSPSQLVRMIEATRAVGLPGVVVWYYRGLESAGALDVLRETVFSEQAPLPWR
jgi:uncharacterized lipoprotein YddW (UPF0748 family)